MKERLFNHLAKSITLTEFFPTCTLLLSYYFRAYSQDCTCIGTLGKKCMKKRYKRVNPPESSKSILCSQASLGLGSVVGITSRHKELQ